MTPKQATGRPSTSAGTSRTASAPAPAMTAGQFQQMMRVMTSMVERLERRSSDAVAPLEQDRARSLLMDFRRMDPPHFLGGPDPMAAERWKSEVKKIFTTMRCTTEERVPLAVFLLQGEAEHWWASVTRATGPDFEWTWEDFVDRFDRKFFPEHVRQQCALEFEMLVQGDMSVSQYEARFVELYRFATYLVDDEGRKARRFESGLCLGLRSRVTGHMLPSFEEVVERAQIYEAEWADAQRIRDQGEDRKGKRKAPSSSFRQQQTRAPERHPAHPSFGPPVAPAAPPAPSQRQFAGVCYGCGGTGHCRHECPHPQQQRQQQPQQQRPQQQQRRRQRGQTHPQQTQGRFYAAQQDPQAPGGVVDVSSQVEYPTMRFGGRIAYCRTFHEVEKATMELLETIKVNEPNIDQISLGLDIEWRPTFRRGEAQRKAAVLQLCMGTDNCYVMHIIHSGIPPILQSLLEDGTSVKVGVCIANDAVKVMKDYNVCIKALEDLSGLANIKLGGVPKKWGLGSLTEMLTCKQLEKPKKIRMGNWEANVLSKEQLQYAATDAYASWYLYQVLKSLPDAANDQVVEEKANGVHNHVDP